MLQRGLLEVDLYCTNIPFLLACKIELKIKYGEALSDEEDTVFSSDDEDSKKKKDPKESKFKTKTSLTTVTVIEDMDQDDGTFGMPKNNTTAMAKGAKKIESKSGEQDGEDDENEGEEEGGDKKRQKFGSSSATTAKGAKKVFPPKEKKKKFRKFFCFLYVIVSLSRIRSALQDHLLLSPNYPLTRFFLWLGFFLLLRYDRLRRKSAEKNYGDDG